MADSVNKFKEEIKEDVSSDINEIVESSVESSVVTTKREFFVGMFNTGESVYLSPSILSEVDNVLPQIKSNTTGVRHIFEFETLEKGSKTRKRIDCVIDNDEGMELDEFLVITGLVAKVVDRMPQGVQEKVYKRLLDRIFASVSVKQDVPTEFMRLGYLDLGATNLRSRVVPLNPEVTEFEVIE